MVWQRISSAALMIAILLTGINLAFAGQPPQTKQNTRLDRAETLKAKLGLSSKQTDEIRRICAEFDKKTEPIERQLWGLHRQERQQMVEVLSKEQRARMPEVAKAQIQKGMQTVAAELGLKEEQRKRLETICDQFEKKFNDLAANATDAAKQFHELRSEAFDAIRQEFTADQRIQVPGVFREEFHKWHDPAKLHEQLKAIGDALGVDDNQRAQVQKIRAEFEPKIKAPVEQLQQLHKDERAAIEHVLTPEQLMRLRELTAGHRGDGLPRRPSDD
jgi:hypothetical protein